LSPILGIIASQNYPRVTNSYESIATVTVGSGGQANITFSSIPNTYKHLQIRGGIRSDRSGEFDELVLMQFNNDTTANYSWHAVDTSISSTPVYAEGASSTASARILATTGAASSSTIMGATIIDILEYKNTNIYKTVRALSGWNNNTYGALWFGSMNWRVADAIHTIVIKPQYGSNFTEFSKLALYGIKG
jgi:hypothetical protein